MKYDSYQHIVITLLLILIAVNLLILDVKVFSSQSVQISGITTSSTPTSQAPISPLSSISDSCPNSCLTLIKDATRSSTALSPLYPLTRIPSSSPREFYIPLGTGSTQKNDWDDLLSTDTLIDPANYGNIKEIYFIAALRNPTQNGQIEAQLYNVTDKHLVWNSNVVMNGPLSQTLTSAKITLDTGAKLYRVQLKSSLQAPANLDTGKIRIIAEEK